MKNLNNLFLFALISLLTVSLNAQSVDEIIENYFGSADFTGVHGKLQKYYWYTTLNYTTWDKPYHRWRGGPVGGIIEV